MNLIDELRIMRNKGRYVVSIDFVLDSLRESQRLDNAKRSSLEVIPFESLKMDYESVERGGDINGQQEKIQIQRSQR